MAATDELRALWGVVVKNWRIFLSYKVWFASDIAFGLFFVGQALLIGIGLTGERNSQALQNITGYSDYVAFAVLGFMVLSFGLTFMGGFVWSVVDELYAGTLEYNFASPMNRLTFFLGNVLLRIVMNGIYLVFYMLIFKLIFNIQLNFVNFAKALPILLLGSIGMIGFGLAAAGIVLYLRDPGPFINILEMLIFALSGAMYPVSILPKGLQILAKALPYAPTTDAIRKIVAFGYSQSSGEISYLVFISSVYAFIGYITYKWSEKQARTVGLKSY
ncbi:multidrug ABC transporter permease [Palaeococcus pacificus DY20341]|uniref:Multidrug ABC transporter permease n=1 Tax=Palaeococcus pacificus DY20341 TaxID=1343739 RepID=A0A075LUJ4_9EURY|nr:ABC transporter permease [Palaeococcus pacificus]AIF70049.1 multidrug ABC transporter permease [Palaeococcus pacificus DY20341]